MARMVPLFPSTMATPLQRNDASMARTRMALMGQHTECEKNASGGAKKQTHNPKPSLPGERRNCRHRDCDLEHSHAPREHHMPMKISSRLGLLLLSLSLNLCLLLLVLRDFGAVFLVWRRRE